MSKYLSSFFKSSTPPSKKADESPKTEIPILEFSSKSCKSIDDPITEEEALKVKEIQQDRAELTKNLPEEDLSNGITLKFDPNSWLDDDWNVIRFLRARKRVVEDTKKAIIKTFEWRIKYRPHAIDPNEIQEEFKTGKTYLNGFDLWGRPVLVMKPYNQNTKVPDLQIKAVVFLMEIASKIMPSGVTKLVIMIDLSKITFNSLTSPKVSNMFLEVLQSHYPERLGKGIIINAPSIFLITYKIISPFIDPITKNKIFFSSFNPSKSQRSTQKSSAANSISGGSSQNTPTPLENTSSPVDSAPTSQNSISESATPGPLSTNPNNEKKTPEPSESLPVGSAGPSATILDYFDPLFLESSLGGQFNFSFNFDVYWPLLVKKYQFIG
ncbi:CRAL-TRIO domain-containing protein [Smittium mucronatum]|uniref:CRAL-TRIO domain-containing protein n=1 Tax=Smittium mucronatum TaxID=133383 RepID=A0A1R0H6N1_9FUNG|nr:CRAL-TRIO domain-containing protein [Smittium mucronatum]